MRQARRIAVALLTAALAYALGGLLAPAAGAAPAAAPFAAPAYPPSGPPCVLSWQTATTDSVTLTGSGLGHRQPVHVTLWPQSTTVGSWVTDSAGSFQAHVALGSLDTASATNASSEWLMAATRKTSCVVNPPGSGGSSSPPVGSGSSAPSGGSTAPAPGGSSGSLATGGGNRSGGGTGGGAGPGTPLLGRSGVSATQGADASGSAPASNGTSSPPPGSRSSTPATPPSTGPSTPRPVLAGPVADLGLPASLVVTIAALLLLAGGLAVVFLTRRAE